MSRHPEMLENKAMARELIKKEAIDLAPYYTGTESPEGVTLYRLPPTLSINGLDLCDTDREKWIWSVGRNKRTGEVIASTDTRFYCNPEWECLWLR